MLTLLIILGIVALVVIIGVVLYNQLVSLRQQADEAWSDIDIQLKRRYDLIPNLVETVQGYAKHERELFENVTKARADAISAEGVDQQAQAENVLTGALRSVFAVAENYPDLRATENFQKLQDELTDTENKIMAARRFYNSNVMALNTKIQQFPTNIVARFGNFAEREFFELDEADAAAREPVKVDF